MCTCLPIKIYAKIEEGNVTACNFSTDTTLIHDEVSAAIPKCPTMGEQKRQNLNQAVCKTACSQIILFKLFPSNKNFWLMFWACSEPWHGLPITANTQGCPCSSMGCPQAVVPGECPCNSVHHLWATLFFFWTGRGQFMSSSHTGEDARPLPLKPCQFCPLHHTFSLYQKFNLVSSRRQWVGTGWQK